MKHVFCLVQVWSPKTMLRANVKVIRIRVNGPGVLKDERWIFIEGPKKLGD